MLHKRLLKVYPELKSLSKCELEVFSQLRTDKTQVQIAQALFITHSAVHFHCKNIYRKLEINSRRQLLILINNAILRIFRSPMRLRLMVSANY